MAEQCYQPDLLLKVLAFDVNWDNDTKTISITPRQEATTEITTVEESTETTTS